MNARRVWSELLPYARLRDRAVLRPLAERGISVVLAVTPPDVGEVARVAGAASEAGVPVGVWPMLDRTDGRWPNALNVEAFADHTRRVLDALGRRPALLAVDLEPPLSELDRALRGDLRVIARWARRRGLARARASFATLVSRVRADEIDTLAAVLPQVVGRGRSARGWERALGTPVAGVPFDRVSPMLYTSLIEGYGGRAVGRADAVAVLAVLARRARRRFGARASVSLGAVGTGALGDEPTYRSVSELAEDVAQARAAGVEDILLFDLAGIEARPPRERWLDALVHTEPARARARLTPRARAGLALFDAAGRVLDVLHARRDR